MSEKDAVAEAKEAFGLAQEHEAENRQDALDDIRFARLGEQWPTDIRRDRELDGRPCLTINRLPAFIRQVVNDGRQNRPAITVHPVDSASDPETAEILNGLIRNIEQSSDADVAYDTALDFAVTGGFGYFQIDLQYAHDDTFEQDIVINRIANPFSVYGDPASSAADSSDWNTSFVLDLVTKAQFDQRWKGREFTSFSDTLDSDLRRKDSEDTAVIASHWSRETVTRRIYALSNGDVVSEEVLRANQQAFAATGVTVIGQPREVPSYKVTQRLLSGSEVLETVEWAGKYIPIVPVYGEEIYVDGRRRLRSLVRDAKDPQRMFNYWRTVSTELVALAPKAPFIGRKGAFETDAVKWATANTQSHAYIEYDGPEAPQRQPFSGVPAGAIQEALNSADDMKSIMGLHDASLGARSNETSGKAIMARQREGDISTFHYIDNLNRAIRHAGRILVDLIPKVYATPRVLRILGPDGTAQTVPANQPFMAQVQDASGEVRQVEKIYNLTTGRYDVTVKAGPSFTSRREEAATQMIELIRAYPDAAPVIGDLLAKNLDWPGADEIAERLKKMLPAQLQGESPEAQQAQAEMQKLAQLVEQLQQQLAQAKGDQAVKARETEIKAFEAETDRMKVEGELALAAKDQRIAQLEAVIQQLSGGAIQAAA